MLGARPAGLRDSLLQRFASPEDAYGGVARRQALLFSVGLDRSAGDLDCFQGISVFGLQRRRQARHARADLSGHLGRRQLARPEFPRERVRSPVGGTTPPELIDGRILQRSIEPGDNRLISRRLLGSGAELGERLLQNVLGDGAIADLSLQIPQKRTVILEEQGDRRRGLMIRSSFVRHRNQYRHRVIHHALSDHCSPLENFSRAVGNPPRPSDLHLRIASSPILLFDY